MEVQTSEGKIKLLRLKEVNDKIEWTGDWSFKCEKWNHHEESKQHIGYD